MKKRTFTSNISALLFALVLFCFQLGFSQLKATITDELGNPLEYATAALYNSNGKLMVRGGSSFVVLLDTNEQRITTWRENEFYTTTNYIYEVDMITLNLSYIFQNGKNRSKFIESEFGKREF